MPDLRVKSSYSPSPNATGGVPGGSSAPGCGISANPFTLTGTSITELSTDALALSARMHRRASEQYNRPELWFYRDATWQMFPPELQPMCDGQNSIKINREWQQPTTMDFSIMDANGDLDVKNLESAYNYNNANVLDPLVNEARKILLRLGIYTYDNIAVGSTVSLSAPGGTFTGTTSQFTDGVLASYSTFAVGTYCFVTSPNQFEIQFDFGVVKPVKHCVFRTGSKIGTCLLPTFVQPMYSDNGTDWTSLPGKPVGGPGSSSSAPGLWDDSYDGIAVEVYFADLDIRSRYFKFVVTPNGSDTVIMDEIAIYGGAGGTLLGKNVFVGYVGDKVDSGPNQNGKVDFSVTGTTRKMKDNNKVKLTVPYVQDENGAIELADIAYNLLTNVQYWTASGGYGAPFDPTEIGWGTGTSYTTFRFPLWQGQNNSIFGYVQELFNTIGWDVYDDSNGIIQARDPAFTQASPDRVLTANTPDGLGDVRQCVRHRTAKNMRNAVEISSGKTTAAGSGFIRKTEPNSIALYGERTTQITDPIALTSEIRSRIGDYFIRDYANNLQTLEAEFASDFDTDIRQIFGIRAPARGGNINAKACTVVGMRQERELWSLHRYVDDISTGDWKATAEFYTYFPQGLLAPEFTSIDPGTPYVFSGSSVADLVLHWTAITDPKAVTLNIYRSTTNEDIGFSLVATASPGAINAIIPRRPVGGTEWYYLAVVDLHGAESVPSNVIAVIPGSSAVGPAEYQITDYSVSSTLKSGPDTQGYYTYQFAALWTAPTGGFTQNRVHCAFDAIPSAPTLESSWPITEGAWHWWDPHRIPAGKEWDRLTDGQLNATYRMRSKTNLTGRTVYWRQWNSTATRSWHPVASNIASTVVV